MNEEQKQPKRTKKAWSIANVMRWLSRKSERTIEVEIPIGFMNCGISTCNNFIADTNNNSNWDTLKFPLPKPKYKWNIKYYKNIGDKFNKKIVVLIDAYQLAHNGTQVWVCNFAIINTKIKQND